MIVRGFKPVGWVAGIGAAALCCYMLSLQVASERAELAGIERQIVSAQQSIRSLQTELSTRGRLTQLERWNADVLALSAPGPGQFLDSGVRLAAFDTRQPDLGDTVGQIRLASAETRNEEALPRPQQAVARIQTAEAAPETLISRASLPLPSSGGLESARGVTRASSLLDDRTLQELRTKSTTEQEGGTGD